MMRTSREGVEQKLAQARRLALEPNDPLTNERLAQMIEELELQLQDQPRSNILGRRFAMVAGR
jgi:cytochrome c-type biogenesis protein CcmH/NrfG